MKLSTRIRSTAMGVLTSEAFLHLLQFWARTRRKLQGSEPVVHYFHQVDDFYSHLAVQKLDLLKATYALSFECHLVVGPTDDFQGSAEHFDQWALRDAQSIAEAYGVALGDDARQPSLEQVDQANSMLVLLKDKPEFAARAFELGELLFKGIKLDNKLPKGDGAAALNAGTTLRRTLGHYLGGMFYFDGEWFWGIDRIRSLEQRLKAEGFSLSPDACVPEPTPVDTSGLAAASVTLEYFPSLRSPYTAVGHQRLLDLVERSGVTLDLRPVMPMMMRGVPAPSAKQRYIITDSAREARFRQVPFGRIVDPLGEPVKRAFALFPAAVKLGKGLEFVTSYLSAAWAEGVDITEEQGLRQVVGRIGIDWDELNQMAKGIDWQGILDDNVNDMLEAGLWGVPSFRVSGGNDVTAFACWGQDRIWLVENEIARRMK